MRGTSLPDVPSVPLPVNTVMFCDAKTKYPEVKFHAEKLESPLYAVIPLLINVAPNGDLFHPEINRQQIRKIFWVINQTPQHQYLILTRRPQRINKLKLHIPASPNPVRDFNFWVLVDCAHTCKA